MTETSGSQRAENSLPLWIRVLGWMAFPGTLALALRLLYEQTVLTWTAGPQLVGFSLVHLYGELFVLMVFCAVLAHLFLLGVIGLIVLRVLRRAPLPTTSWVQVTAIFVCTAVLYVPYGVWKLAIIEIGGPGQYAGEHLSLAAAEGETYVVRALLAKGVAVDTPDSDGSTALNAACVGKKVEMARFLLSKGADLSRAPACRWVKGLGPYPDLPRVPGTTIEVH